MSATKATSIRVKNLPGVRRLPMYVKLLRRWAGEGRAVLSAEQLAQACDMVTAVVKKDIELTGAVGKAGVGYETETLLAAMETFLGWNRDTAAVMVGAGRLGCALLGYAGLRRRGVRFVAAFDADRGKIGRDVQGVPVLDAARITAWTRKHDVTLAVLCVPSTAAQGLAESLVAGGVTKLWSFASDPLSVPPGVTVQREDLSAGLAELMVRARFGDG